MNLSTPRSMITLPMLSTENAQCINRTPLARQGREGVAPSTVSMLLASPWKEFFGVLKGDPEQSKEKTQSKELTS
jgi:hypothetical protein